MASRALGAFFALAAAAAFVVSIATSAWWAGAPIVEGKEIAAKYVHAGPLGVIGCNVGGDLSCETVATSSTVQLVGYAALGATAVATLFLLILLVAAWRVSDHRRGFATASTLVTLLAAGAGGALLALGPGIEASQRVEVPYGYGLIVFGGGVLVSLLASLVTRRVEREPLRLKSSRQRNAPKPGRPAAQPMPAPQPMAQPMAMPAAPYAPPQSAAMPHSPYPPPQLAAMPQSPYPPPQPAAMPQAPYVPPQPSAAVPPARTKPPTHAPPPPRANRPSAPPIPAARQTDPSLRARRPSDPMRAQRPSDPPIPTRHTPPGDALRAKPVAPPRSPTIAHTVPPMPITDRHPILNRATTETDDRLETSLRETDYMAAVDIDVDADSAGSAVDRPPNATSHDRAQPPLMPVGRPPYPNRSANLDGRRAAVPSPRRADTDIRTGKNRIAEATDVGIEPAPEPDRFDGAAADPAGPADAAAEPTGSDAAAELTGPDAAAELTGPDAAAELAGRADAAGEPISSAHAAGERTGADPASGPGERTSQTLMATESVKRTSHPMMAEPGKPTSRPLFPEPAQRTSRPVFPEPAQRTSRPVFPAPTKPTSQPAIAEPAQRTSRPAILAPAKRGLQPAIPEPAQRGSQPAIPEPAKRGSQPPIPAPAKRGSQPAIPAPAKRPSQPMTAEPAERTSQPQIATESAVPESAPGDHTAQTLMAPEPPRRDPEDLMRTIEQNPKLPSPRVDRTAQTPIPTVDAERAAHVPISTAPSSLPPPKQLEPVQSGPTPACPQCESPMSWVDEHLRFYCRSCRMYF